MRSRADEPDLSGDGRGASTPTGPPTPTGSTGWMDSARVLAIVAVVLIHVVAPSVEGQGLDIGSPGWWLANVLDSASRWSVPVFVMIAGALALDPARAAPPGELYRRRWWRLGVPLVFWTAFYLLFRAGVLGTDLTVDEVAADVAAGSPFQQLYFLYVLVGLVLITPFLQVITRHASRRMQLTFAAVLVGVGVLDQALTFAGGVGEPNAATRFLPYTGYYVLGWVLRDVVPGRRGLAATGLAFFASLVSVAGLAAVQDFGDLGRYAYAYLSPPVVVMTVAAYVLLHALLATHAISLRRAAPLAFGVFLVHVALLSSFRSVTGPPNDLADLAVTALALTGALTVTSAAITWVVLRVPYLRMVLGEPAHAEADEPHGRRPSVHEEGTPASRTTVASLSSPGR